MPSQIPTDIQTSVIPHLGLMKGGNFNPTPIDRVNKSISKNMRLT